MFFSLSVGRPASPFIGEGKARFTEEEKEKNEREKKASRVAGSFSFMQVPHEEEEGPSNPGSLLLFLLFFYFSSIVTPAFPSPIKGEVGHPMKGDPDPHETEPRDKSTRAAIELSAPIHSFRQRLGILSLSHLFVTPTVNQVPVT